MAAADLTGAQRKVLAVIKPHYQSATQVRDALGFPRMSSTLTNVRNVLAQLAELGLVERSQLGHGPVGFRRTR